VNKTSPTLIDGLARANEAPGTFKIPTRAQRLTARIGQMVKIGLETEPDEVGCSGERFWVVITGSTDEHGDLVYVGEQVGDLIRFPQFLNRHRWVFKQENILAVS